jgi:hypothetical protein
VESWTGKMAPVGPSQPAASLSGCHLAFSAFQLYGCSLSVCHSRTSRSFNYQCLVLSTVRLTRPKLATSFLIPHSSLTSHLNPPPHPSLLFHSFIIYFSPSSPLNFTLSHTPSIHNTHY